MVINFDMDFKVHFLVFIIPSTSITGHRISGPTLLNTSSNHSHTYEKIAMEHQLDLRRLTIHETTKNKPIRAIMMKRNILLLDCTSLLVLSVLGRVRNYNNEYDKND